MLGEKIVNSMFEHRSTSLAVIATSVVAAWSAGSYALGEIADADYGSGTAAAYVKEHGYTDVHLKGIDHFPGTVLKDCDADNTEYEFTATDPRGVHMNIDVCKRLGIEPKLIREG